MRKRITPSQLRVGMFISSIEGEWLDNPFWRRSFLVKTEDELKRLRSSAIQSIVIDESRGEKLDLPPPVTRRLPSAREINHRKTKAMVAQAKQAVQNLFAEARMGGGVSGSAAVEIVTQIAQSMQRDPRLLLDLTRIKSRDENTFLHSIAVSGLMIQLGARLGMDPQTISELGVAGLVHDIGKVTIPNEILNKTGPLTPEERAIMETHPERGHEILTLQGDMPAIVLDVCLHHHRRVDGGGYPATADGEVPSLPSRIAAICDVYDAITSIRPYKNPWSPAEALARMQSWEGQFDRDVFAVFLQMMGYARVPLSDKRREQADTDG